MYRKKIGNGKYIGVTVHNYSLGQYCIYNRGASRGTLFSGDKKSNLGNETYE